MDTEIKIEINRDDKIISTVTIHDTVPVETTLAVQRSEQENHLIVKEWVSKVRSIFYNKNQTVVIGLVAESSQHYRNGNYISHRDSKKKKVPLELLQLYVGNYCLFYHTSRYEPAKSIPKALRDLLWDNRTVVAGVGMEEVAKKIEYQLKLKISRPEDLNVLAALAGKFRVGYFAKYNVMELANQVLDGDLPWKKPDSIHWWEPGEVWEDNALSLDKVKYGTVEAFLAYEMGMKLLEF